MVRDVPNNDGVQFPLDAVLLRSSGAQPPPRPLERWLRRLLSSSVAEERPVVPSGAAALLH